MASNRSRVRTRAASAVNIRDSISHASSLSVSPARSPHLFVDGVTNTSPSLRARSSPAYPHSLRINNFLESIPKFSSSSTTSLDEFLDRLNMIGDHNGWSSEDKLFALKLRLEGIALRFINSNPIYKSSNSFDEIVEALKAQFQSQKTFAERIRDFLALRQQASETVRNFAARAEALSYNAMHIDASPESEIQRQALLFSVFTQGLQSDLKKLVLRNTPKDFITAKNLAILEEEYLKSNETSNVNNIDIGNVAAVKHHSTQDMSSKCSFKDLLDKQAKQIATLTQQIAELQKSLKQLCGSNVSKKNKLVCGRCKLIGHLRNTCRVRLKNNNNLRPQPYNVRNAYYYNRNRNQFNNSGPSFVRRISPRYNNSNNRNNFRNNFNNQNNDGNSSVTGNRQFRCNRQAPYNRNNNNNSQNKEHTASCTNGDLVQSCTHHNNNNSQAHPNTTNRKCNCKTMMNSCFAKKGKIKSPPKSNHQSSVVSKNPKVVDNPESKNQSSVATSAVGYVDPLDSDVTYESDFGKLFVVPPPNYNKLSSPPTLVDFSFVPSWFKSTKAQPTHEHFSELYSVSESSSPPIVDGIASSSAIKDFIFPDANAQKCVFEANKRRFNIAKTLKNSGSSSLKCTCLSKDKSLDVSAVYAEENSSLSFQLSGYLANCYVQSNAQFEFPVDCHHSSAIKPFESLLQLEIQGIDMIALADTGSSVNIIYSDAIRDVDLNSIPMEHKPINLCAFNNQTSNTSKLLTLGININNTIYDAKFFLLECPSPYQYQAILGQDFLIQYNINIDFRRKLLKSPYFTLPFCSDKTPTTSCSVHCHDETSLPVQLTIPDTHENSTFPPPVNNFSSLQHKQTSSYSDDPVIAVSSRKFTLPPRSETVIEVTHTQCGNENDVILVQEFNLNHPFNVAKCICYTNPNNTLPIKIGNFTNKPIYINKGQKLCILERLSVTEKSCVSNVNDCDNAEPVDQFESWGGEFNLDHLSPNHRRKLLALLKKYRSVFASKVSELTGCDTLLHEIHLTCDKPVHQKSYRVPQHLQGELRKQVSELLDANIIQESYSPFNAPVLFVKKPDNTYRMVCDFRRLNLVTIGESFPIPNINELIDSLQGASFFSTLDMTSGFYQVLLNPADAHKTAFSTPFGHYEFLRCPFGLKNSPISFQRLMSIVMSGNTGIYIDDIIVASSTFEEHLEKLESVFKRLNKHKLKLKPNKCHFFKDVIKYLGFQVSKGKVQPDAQNIETVKNFKIPTSFKNVRQFLGLTGFYRKFIENYAEISLPLTSLLKGKKRKFEWNSFAQQAFENLKNKLLSEPILRLPNFKLPFTIYTDASKYAIGAVLTQLDENNFPCPVQYASRKLKDAEINYSVVEKEALAVVWACTHFKHYLLGRHFTVICDQASLSHIFKFRDPTSRLARWIMTLSQYDYSVVHKPGKQNITADYLSRCVYGTSSSCVNNQPATTSGQYNPMPTSSSSQPLQSSSQVLPPVQDFPSKNSQFNSCQQCVSSLDNVQEQTMPASSSINPQSQSHFHDSSFHHQMNSRGAASQSTQHPCYPCSQEQSHSTQNSSQLQQSSLQNFSCEQCQQEVLRSQQHEHSSSQHFSSCPLYNCPTPLMDEQPGQVNCFDCDQDECDPGAHVASVSSSPARETVRSESHHFQPNTVRSFPYSCCRNENDDNIYQIPSIGNQFTSPSTNTLYEDPIQLVDLSSPPANQVTAIAEDNDSSQRSMLSVDSSLYTQIVNGQKQDPKCNKIRSLLEEGKAVFPNHLQFFVKNDVLYCTNKHPVKRFQFKNRLVVPTNVIPQVLEACHDVSSAAHGGLNKTLARISANFYWQNLFAHTKNYIKSCKTCVAARGHRYKRPAPLQEFENTTFPFERVACDVVGPLAESSSGNKYLLVMTDYFTRWSEAFPLSSIRTNDILSCLEKFVTIHGIPRHLITDRGTNFLSTAALRLYEKLGIKKHSCTAFHPSSDGVCERLNATLMASLRNLILENTDDWDKLINFALLAHRSSVHSATGETPAFLLYGRDICLPENLLAQEETSSYHSINDYTTDFQFRMKKAFEQVRNNLAKAQESQLAHQHKKAKMPDINVGDQVYLYVPMLQKGQSKKLSTFNRGVYTVTKKFSAVNFEVQHNDNTADRQRVHINRLSKLHPRRKELCRHGKELPPKKTSGKKKVNKRKKQQRTVSFEEDQVFSLPPLPQRAKSSSRYNLRRRNAALNFADNNASE